MGRLRLRSLVQLIDSDGLVSAKFFGVVVGHMFFPRCVDGGGWRWGWCRDWSWVEGEEEEERSGRVGGGGVVVAEVGEERAVEGGKEWRCDGGKWGSTPCGLDRSRSGKLPPVNCF